MPQAEAESAKIFLAVCNMPKIVLQTLGKPASRFQSIDRELKVPRTLVHFRSDPAHVQAEAQSAKSFLAVWNMPKIVLQTLGKPASRVQSLNRELNAPRTFAHFRSAQAHTQVEAQSAKSFLAVWNMPKIVLQTLGEPASRLQSLDRELKVPRTLAHFRSDPAHAQAEAQSVFGNIQEATLSLEDCILFPRSNDLHSSEACFPLTTFHSFLSFKV